MEIDRIEVNSFNVYALMDLCTECVQKISKYKNCSGFNVIIEVFSEHVQETFELYHTLYYTPFEIKLSKGKMCKNFIKIYFLEMPLDYIIIEVLSFSDAYSKKTINPNFYTIVKIN